MYNIDHLESKVVTFILASGREIICELLNSVDNIAVVNNPRYVTFNGQTGEANMIIMTVTSKLETAHFNMDTVLTVFEASESVALEYRDIIAQEALAEAEAEQETVDA